MEDFDLNESLNGLWEKLAAWMDSIILALPNFLLAILVLVLFVIAANYASKLLNKLLQFKIKQDSIREITVKIVKLIIILIGFFIALGILELNTILTSILAGAGVVGLAIGLALQGTLNNTFSGIILSFIPELQLGDWIETGDFAGSVTQISLRSVVIKEADNNYVIIPNSKIVQEPFKNFSRTPRSRVMLECGVAYDSDLELVQKLTIDTMQSLFAQQGNEEVEFMYQEFADSSINFIVRFWTPVTNRKDILVAKNKAIIALKKAFDENNINIPFPIRTIDFTNKLSINKPGDSE